MVPIGKEYNESDAQIWTSISGWFLYTLSLIGHHVIYFHNLKFDGTFILDYLKRMTKYQEDLVITDDFQKEWRRVPKVHHYTYMISKEGQWYRIMIKTGKGLIEIRDSLKLLPMSLQNIGDGFKTEHRKLTMDYAGHDRPGQEITEEERKYIINDVMVLKEAVEFLQDRGITALTIGSECMREWKETLEKSGKVHDKKEFETYFPDLYQVHIDKKYGAENADAYIRKAYKGGWCYADPRYSGKVQGSGSVTDANSMYPSQMHSDSGNYYPVGFPTFWEGNIPEEIVRKDNIFYYIRIRCRFYLKPRKLPTVQIKGDSRYRGNEWLRTSDVYFHGKYYNSLRDKEGNIKPVTVTLTLSKIDWEMLQEHYNLADLEILDGCYFSAVRGLFDDYINKWGEIKRQSKGALRQLAKLYLNNLYGKMAASNDSSFRVLKIEDDALEGEVIEGNDKRPGYIPIGAAITAYARRAVITAAQNNYSVFAYADTDSVHCLCKASEVKGIPIHPTNFCCWKVENSFDRAIYVRQKTYIEHMTEADGEAIRPYYSVKACGMVKRVQDMVGAALDGKVLSGYEKEETEWMKKGMKMTDFRSGFVAPGALKARVVNGGTVLRKSEFKIH